MDLTLLTPEEWQARLKTHEERAHSFTKEHLARRRAGKKHPVWDFLFEYYPIKPATLAKWHPGVGIGLLFDDPTNPQGHSALPHASWRDYVVVKTPNGPAVTADLKGLWDRRGKSYRYIHDLLSAVDDNQTHFDCFGLHEWAMVYRTDAPRHDLPLRLGAEGTNTVVEKHNIRCTHYDAYRFFTEAAKPLNFTVLSRDDQPRSDQRGCVHATMDLYKWAHKLGPLVPGDLWLDTFELAIEARRLDMEASPYDCREYGFDVVAVETPEGKAQYTRRQRNLAESAEPLRHRLVSLIEASDVIRIA